jgi:L-ascorbate metabolism protein UlaG (beta-lactamase superfamily)
MRTFRWTVSLATVALAIVGCSSSTVTPTAAPSSAAKTAASANPAVKTLTIAHEESCQVELIAPSGERILIDVADPTLLTSPAKASDILLTTHLHSDHYNQTFEQSFPGKKITNETTDLTVGDINIKSIAASHDDSPINADQPTNHIFIIEFNGFKIVHGGSTGQLKLTPEQLSAIGDNVDIGALVLQNVGGSDPASNKAIDIVDQINPKILIPTHSTLEYAKAGGKAWKATYSSKETVTIPHDQLPAQTTMLFMGQLATSYGAILNAPETSW